MSTKPIQITGAPQTITSEDMDKRFGPDLKKKLCKGSDTEVAESCEAAIHQALTEAIFVASTPYYYEMVQGAANMPGRYSDSNFETGNWTYTYQSKEKSAGNSQFTVDGFSLTNGGDGSACETTTRKITTGINMTYAGRSVWTPLFSFVSEQTTCDSGGDIKAEFDAAMSRIILTGEELMQSPGNEIESQD